MVYGFKRGPRGDFRRKYQRGKEKQAVSLGFTLCVKRDILALLRRESGVASECEPNYIITVFVRESARQAAVGLQKQTRAHAVRVKNIKTAAEDSARAISFGKGKKDLRIKRE